jgi:hypothetical protein
VVPSAIPVPLSVKFRQHGHAGQHHGFPNNRFSSSISATIPLLHYVCGIEQFSLTPLTPTGRVRTVCIEKALRALYASSVS